MFYDTQIAAHLLDSTEKRLDLPSILSRWLSLESTQDVASSGQLHPLTRKLNSVLKESKSDSVFTSIELPLLSILVDMERNGVLVDDAILNNLSDQWHSKVSHMEKEIHGLAGESFNINSPKQLQVILFEKLKLPVLKKIKTGSSTNASVLEELALEHELPRKIIEYREVSKLLSTYVDSLPSDINPVTKRIHSTFSQTGAATGRLSSRDPNLQNIPIRTELGREIRKAFIVPRGSVLLSADYSQIELRVLAHASTDENMIAGFQNGHDIHTATASKVLNVPLEKVTNDQRRSAKAINFGLLYGMGSFRLSKELGITMEEAKTFIEQYFAAYPNVKTYMDTVIQQGKKDGFVTTLFGRRRPIPEINSANHTLSELGKREAVNSVIQGTAADIIKLAMIAVHAALNQAGLQTRMILQIHDELVFEVLEKEVEQTSSLIKTTMESVAKLSVPLIVETGMGESWFEAH